MSTSNVNRVAYGTISGVWSQVQCKINHASFAIAQGDLVFLDSGIAKPVTANADVATLIGLALQPSAVSSSLDLSSAPAEKTIQVANDGIVANMKTTAAETYTDGLAVYIGADAQTVTTVAPMSPHSVGVVILPAGIASLTGAAGVNVPVKLKGVAY